MRTRSVRYWKQYEGRVSAGGEAVETVYSIVVGEGALMERRQWGGAIDGAIGRGREGRGVILLIGACRIRSTGFEDIQITCIIGLSPGPCRSPAFSRGLAWHAFPLATETSH